MAGADDIAGPNVWVVEFVDEDVAAPAQGGTAADCPDCCGAGKICLLITTRPCQKCGGSGRAVAYEGSPGEPSDEPAGNSVSIEWVGSSGAGRGLLFIMGRRGQGRRSRLSGRSGGPEQGSEAV